MKGLLLSDKIEIDIKHSQLFNMPHVRNVLSLYINDSLSNMENLIKPNISKRVFWDIDFDTLDYDKDRFFIIDKVMNYGMWDDFLAVMRHYGKEVVKKEIVKSPYLKKDVLNFLCFYLDLKPEDFECYTRRQLQEPHWAY
jgi:hypothetical protein